MRLSFGLAGLVISAILLSGAGARADEIGPLAGKRFGAGTKVTVVLLHGDVSRGGPADYLYPVAEGIAQRHPGASVYAVLRPGYEDSVGLVSPGSNNGRRDHYTEENNDLVAAALQAVKAPGVPLVVLGHSGGAAQLGVVIARHPGLVDTAILAACPCDILRWREMQGRRPWDLSQSPQAFADDVPATAHVRALTGTADDNTNPVLAEDYVASLSGRGVDAVFQPVPGAGHDFSGTLAAAAVAALEAEIDRIR